jgi:hypothetical protein
MADTVDLSTLTDAQALALTGAAEARAYFDGRIWRPAPMANMVAVMCTPINRVKANPKRFGATVKDACLAHAQFSCWNANSGVNHDWLMQQAAAVLQGRYIAPIVKQCLAAAEQLLDGVTADVVAGATHYYAPVSMVPPGRVPDWAAGKEPVAAVGDHLFFKGV